MEDQHLCQISSLIKEFIFECIGLSNNCVVCYSSIEASAQHEAMRIEQKARGHLERQKLDNEKRSEIERCKLLQLQAITAAVESSGQATAEAQAQAERILIECESEIEGKPCLKVDRTLWDLENVYL